MFVWALLLMLCKITIALADDGSVIDYGATPDDREDDVVAFIKAMKSPHAIVLVPTGHYILSDLRQYVPLYSNKTVHCETGAELLVPQEAVTHPGRSRNGYAFSPVFGLGFTDRPVHRFTMEGCHFIVEKAGVTPIQIDSEGSSEIHLRNLDVDGRGRGEGNQAAYGVFLNKVSLSSITGTRIRYTRDGGIFARLADQLLLESNEIRFAGVNVSYPFDDPGSAVLNQDYWPAAGISAPSAKNSIVRSNILDNTGGVGILLRGGTNDCRGNQIIDNQLSNIGKGGIGIGIRDGGTGSTIDNVVSGNRIQGYMQRWGDAGININHRGKQGLVGDLHIENNWIDLLPPKGDYPLHSTSKLVPYPQIIIESSDGARIRNVTVSGNVLRNAPGAAISIKHAMSVNVLENDVASAVRIGVNRLMLLTRHVWPYGESLGYAIALYDTTDSLVAGNVVRSLNESYIVDDAPRIYVNGKHNNIEGNLILVQDPDNAGLSVVLVDGSSMSVTGNRFLITTGDLSH